MVPFRSNRCGTSRSLPAGCRLGAEHRLILEVGYFSTVFPGVTSMFSLPVVNLGIFTPSLWDAISAKAESQTTTGCSGELYSSVKSTHANVSDWERACSNVSPVLQDVHPKATAVAHTNNQNFSFLINKLLSDSTVNPLPRCSPKILRRLKRFFLGHQELPTQLAYP